MLNFSQLSSPFTVLIVLLTVALFVSVLVWKYFKKTPLVLQKPDTSDYKLVFGHKLYFTQNGSSKDHILLIHGLGASHYVWRFLVPKLTEKFTVLTVDLLGFGLSDKPSTFKYDMDSQCEVILEFLKQMGIQECILAGSSMGGTIALRLAQIHSKKFPKVITFSPAADPSVVVVNLNKVSFLSPMVQPLITETFVKQIMKRVYNDKSLITPESVKTFSEPYANKDAIDAFVKSFSLIKDQRVNEQLEAMTSPVLILWGQNDKIIPVKYAYKIQSKIPYSELDIHPHAGHHLQEEYPDWVAEQIFNFCFKKSKPSKFLSEAGSK